MVASIICMSCTVFVFVTIVLPVVSYEGLL